MPIFNFFCLQLTSFGSIRSVGQEFPAIADDLRGQKFQPMEAWHFFTFLLFGGLSECAKIMKSHPILDSKKNTSSVFILDCMISKEKSRYCPFSLSVKKL
jgi:hypothetical protein